MKIKELTARRGTKRENDNEKAIPVLLPKFDEILPAEKTPSPEISRKRLRSRQKSENDLDWYANIFDDKDDFNGMLLEENDILHMNDLHNVNESTSKPDRFPQLILFLLKLLNDDKNKSIIRWNSQDMDSFTVVNPEKLAKLWGEKTGKANMSYKNVTRGLRHMYGRDLLAKIDMRNAYRFTFSIPFTSA